jgi:hypothetical protein
MMKINGRVTDGELDKIRRLNKNNENDFDLYEKLQGEGELERLERVREFLQNPKESRKYQRKKKSSKSKSKRKTCKCKK